MLALKGNCVTFFGHSTFSLTTPSGQVALIDPWVMTNPMCPDKLKKVPKLDVIFLSHAHSDHLGDLLALAKQHKPQMVAIFETCLWIGSKGFEKETKPMGKGGTQKVGEFEVTMTHAFHSNSIEEKGKLIYGGEPASFIVRLPGGLILFHAGDTAVFGDMKLIAELYKPVFPNYRKKQGGEAEFSQVVLPGWNGALPTTLFYDKDGKQVGHQVGAGSREVFENAIRQLLGNSASASR